MAGRDEQVALFDTPQLIYSKAKKSMGRFALIQFGLCTFRFIPEKNSYEYRAYSCYVFNRVPREFEGIRLYDTSRSFQWSSLSLLGSHGFDFNKWVLHGVGYLRECDVEKYTRELTRIDELNKARSSERRKDEHAPRVNDQLRPSIGRVIEKLNAFLAGKLPTAELVDGHLVISGLRGIEHRAIVDALDHRFRSRIFIDTIHAGRQGGCSLHIHACHGAPEEFARKALQEKIVSSAGFEVVLKDRLHAAIGFCQVMSLLERAPVIGHNLLLDLLHMCNAFSFDLPDRFADFTTRLAALLPLVIDTKAMCTLAPFKSIIGTSPTSLPDLLHTVLATPFPHDVLLSPCDDAYGYQTVDGVAHDAGYDAFTTGRIFLQMAVFYARFVNSDKTTRVIPLQRLIENVANKLAIPFVQDLPLLALDPQSCEHVPDRTKVFVVHFRDGCYWRVDEVRRLFAVYGGAKEVRFMNDQRAYVVVETVEIAHKVRTALSKCDGRLGLAMKPESFIYAHVQGVDEYNQQMTSIELNTTTVKN